MDETQENRLKECMDDILKKVPEIRTGFLELAPTEWVMRIMKTLRYCALNISDYKEFRQGLIEVGALTLIVMAYSDTLFREYLSKPAPSKLLRYVCPNCGGVGDNGHQARHLRGCPEDPLRRPLP